MTHTIPHEQLEMLWRDVVAQHSFVGEVLLKHLDLFMVKWVCNSLEGITYLQEVLAEHWIDWEDVANVTSQANKACMQMLCLESLVVYRGCKPKFYSDNCLSVRRLSSWSTNESKASSFSLYGGFYTANVKAHQMFASWQWNSILRESMNEYECMVLVQDAYGVVEVTQ